MLLPCQCFGTGIEQAYQDVTAAARANAFIATADHPSAIHYNPAGLIWLDGPAVQSMTFISRSSIRHDNVSGATQDSYQTALTGSFFAAYPGLANDRIAVGLGVTIPHGLGIEWKDDSLLRSIGIEGKLIHLVISPSISFKINDRLSVGLSINYAHNDLEISQGIFVPGDSFSFEGSGDGWGATMGILWKATDKWSLGITYRTQLETEIKGTATTETIFPGVSKSKEKGSAGFDFPQQVIVGAAYKPNDMWLFECNVQWTDWSTYDTFKLELESSSLVVPYNYEDTLLIGLGARYSVSRKVDINFGYLYSTAAVPDDTYSPFVPDAPLHVFSVGMDYKKDQWKLSAAVLYGHRETRRVSGSPVSPTAGVSSDGKWKTDGVSLLFGGTYSF